MRGIHRRRYCDDDEIGLRECCRISRHGELVCSAQVLARHLAGWIDEPAIAFNLGVRQVEADGLALPAELDSERQAHVSQANDGDYAHEFPCRLLAIAVLVLARRRQAACPGSAANILAGRGAPSRPRSRMAILWSAPPCPRSCLPQIRPPRTCAMCVKSNGKQLKWLLMNLSALAARRVRVTLNKMHIALPLPFMAVLNWLSLTARNRLTEFFARRRARLGQPCRIAPRCSVARLCHRAAHLAAFYKALSEGLLNRETRTRSNLMRKRGSSGHKRIISIEPSVSILNSSASCRRLATPFTPASSQSSVFTSF